MMAVNLGLRCYRQPDMLNLLLDRSNSFQHSTSTLDSAHRDLALVCVSLLELVMALEEPPR